METLKPLANSVICAHGRTCRAHLPCWPSRAVEEERAEAMASVAHRIPDGIDIDEVGDDSIGVWRNEDAGRSNFRAVVQTLWSRRDQRWYASVCGAEDRKLPLDP